MDNEVPFQIIISNLPRLAELKSNMWSSTTYTFYTLLTIYAEYLDFPQRLPEENITFKIKSDLNDLPEHYFFYPPDKQGVTLTQKNANEESYQYTLKRIMEELNLNLAEKYVIRKITLDVLNYSDTVQNTEELYNADNLNAYNFLKRRLDQERFLEHYYNPDNPNPESYFRRIKKKHSIKSINEEIKYLKN